MTTIWENVYSALTGLSKPMAESNYKVASGASLPDEYLVYFEVSSNPRQHADDIEKSRNYHVQVSYFNRTGLKNMPDISGAMVTAGFTKGQTRELPYNQDTGHFGLALEFWYYEDQ